MITIGRLVRHNQNKPYEIKPEGGGKSIWICACGLSKNKPYCDGTHKITRDEKEGCIYLYGEDDERIEIKPMY